MWLKRRKVEILIFMMLFLAGASFYHPVEYDNTKSRYFLLSALVDYRTLNIDAYQQYTLDKSEWNGHYYSNKAPGASFLGVPVYWLLRELTPLTVSNGWFALFIVRIVTTTLLFALLGVVMYRLAQFFGVSRRQALIMVIAYGFGSIALLQATLFSGHQIAASLGFFSFALLVRFSSKERMVEIKYWYYGFFAGLLAGFAVITDYTAIVIAICLAVYTVLSQMDVRMKTGFILGGLVCVLILAAYNMACFGHPFSSSYEHLVFNKFREGAEQGVFGAGLPKIEAIIGLLISPSRGIFFIMPVLLFSFWGIVKMILRQQQRREGLLIVSVSVLSFLFISGFYAWHGGWTFGPRYLVPMLPFLAFPIAFLRLRPGLFWLLFIPSCIQVVLSVAVFPHVTNLVVNPIMEFIIPLMIYGYTALNAGMLLHLPWPWSVITVIAIIVLLGVWAFRESSRDELPNAYDRIPSLGLIFPALWICMIAAGIVFLKTYPPETVHLSRSVVLTPAAITYNSPRLQRAAAFEKYLSDSATVTGSNSLR